MVDEEYSNLVGQNCKGNMDTVMNSTSNADISKIMKNNFF